jgi:hypothetical protein
MKRRSRFSYEDDRRLVQLAATSATVEEAAAMFRTSAATIERKAKVLGILRSDRKRLSARTVLKVEK